ncbi:serine/threonine-protein kinase greatwall-like [Galendromus occidentalis]|uniref:Serine/threonine-protein kinase greatwall-like n=1 Tax=Galendromus occidentalis TaxID=34638 RepID=A0AAJ7SEZ3_9ACAR|nr:serine/threonine-protein kinase greatwall-like [Galendromus occidentalis]
MDELAWQEGPVLIRNLGRGRFGSLALIRKDNGNYIRRTVNRLTSNEDLWNRLRILQLAHRNIEQVVSVFVHEADIVIHTAFHSDLTIFDYTRGCFEASLSETRILRWMCQILDGLDYLHRNGFCHGNLTAKNVLIESVNHLRLSNWTLSVLVSKESQTDLQALGHVLLVLITVNSAIDGRYLSQDTVNTLIEASRGVFSDFLLHIILDLVGNGVESVAYLRGLVATSSDPLCGSQTDMLCSSDLQAEDHEQQVDASPMHRRQRAQILHELAREAARTSQNGIKHPSVILTFFNLFKLSIKRWKRIFSPGCTEGATVKDFHPRGLRRTTSCPAKLSTPRYREDVTG